MIYNPVLCVFMHALMSKNDWEVLARGTLLQCICSSPFTDCHCVSSAWSLSCCNYESLCQQKLLHSSSSHFDWQILCCYCYFEHTVPFLWWRHWATNRTDAFLASLLSLLSEKGTAVVKRTVYSVAWTYSKVESNIDQPVLLLWCLVEGWEPSYVMSKWKRAGRTSPDMCIQH